MRDSRPELPPTEQWIERSEPDEHGWVKETHPSYGQIGVSRVASTGNSLFDSDLKHQHFITITIKETERVIDGTHEFLSSGKNVAEICMSEAQFARLMTQPKLVTGNIFDSYVAYLRHSATLIDTVYTFDKAGGFENGGTPESRAFTEERLAAGASELRDLIYTAWVESAQPVQDKY